MSELVIKTLSRDAAKSGKARKSSVTTKTLHRSDGTRVRVHSIDANSPTFGADLLTVFRKNVAKAKRQHAKSGSTRARLRQGA